MLFFTLSNTNVKVALLFCKEKEMTLNAKCSKHIFLKGKKHGKTQYKIKNIPVGGEIADLTVSVKKKRGGCGTMCTIQQGIKGRTHSAYISVTWTSSPTKLFIVKFIFR